MSRVLVVDAEESFRDALSYILRREGFEVATATTGAEVMEDFERNGADMVLLDLVLPGGMGGTEVCRRLRQISRVPLIVVSARDSEIDKVVCLELGADDYVTKPFSSRELIARIHAVMRGYGRQEPIVCPELNAGPVRMDVDRHTVHVREARVNLPLKEFELLEMLLRNAGRVLSRRQIIDRVWGADYPGTIQTVDIHVKRLRAKIEPWPSTPRHLLAIRGVGYKFQP